MVIIDNYKQQQNTKNKMEQTSKKSQKNAKEMNNLNYSREMETIQPENTPFRIQRVQKQWFTALGDKRTSDFYNSYEEAEQDAKTITFDKIIQLIGIILENTDKIEK